MNPIKVNSCYISRYSTVKSEKTPIYLVFSKTFNYYSSSFPAVKARLMCTGFSTIAFKQSASHPSNQNLT